MALKEKAKFIFFPFEISLEMLSTNVLRHCLRNHMNENADYSQISSQLRFLFFFLQCTIYSRKGYHIADRSKQENKVFQIIKIRIEKFRHIRNVFSKFSTGIELLWKSFLVLLSKVGTLKCL